MRIIQMDGTKMSALLVSAQKSHLEIIQLLLQSHKVDINQKNSEVNLYVFIVCKNCSNLIMYFNNVIQNGWTALMQASRHSKRYVVEYLVQQGAATNVQDNVRHANYYFVDCILLIIQYVYYITQKYKILKTII